jgi:hypothetical protein
MAKTVCIVMVKTVFIVMILKNQTQERIQMVIVTLKNFQSLGIIILIIKMVQMATIVILLQIAMVRVEKLQ